MLICTLLLRILYVKDSVFVVIVMLIVLLAQAIFNIVVLRGKLIF